MPDFVTVNVSGLEGLEAALRDAGPKLARQSLTAALKAGGDVFLAAVKSHCPVGVEDTPQATPGELRDALTTQVTFSPKHGSGTVHVGVKKHPEMGSQSPAVYAGFVEFGSVHNPQAKPFLRPGFDESKAAAEAAFTSVLKTGVEHLGDK